MPAIIPAIPLIYWIGGGLVAALGFGGHQFGKEVGEKTGQTVPIVGAIALGLVAYKVVKK